jgi:hypothetical protein
MVSPSAFVDDDDMTSIRTQRIRRVAVLVPVAVLTLAGCGAAQEAVSEQLVEQAVGEGVDVEIGDDGQVASIQTEDGSLDIQAGGDVPEEWPGDLPLFDDGELTSSQVATSDGQTVISLSYTTDRDAEAVFEALVAEYESAGFTSAAKSNIGDATGGFSSYAGERDGTTVTVGVVFGEGSATSVQLGLVTPAG